MNSYKVSAMESTALELGVPDTVKSVLQAIKIILTTPKGTVPMYRDFGVNMDFWTCQLQARSSGRGWRFGRPLKHGNQGQES